MTRSTFALLAAVCVALLAGCRTAPSPSTFVDVSLHESALPGTRQLPGLADGAERLGVSVARDGADLLLDFGWWRNLTDSELSNLTDSEFNGVLVMHIGAGEVRVRAWNADCTRALQCAWQHMASCGNHGAIHDWTRCRLAQASGVVCVEITWRNQQCCWRIPE